MATTDIFGKTVQEIQSPFTADRALILIGDQAVAGAQNITITYAQPVQKRRSIGSKQALIFSGQPMGQISIARLVAQKAIPGLDGSGFPAFGTGIWNACDFSDPRQRELKFEMQGGPCLVGGNATNIFALIATGCVITNYSLSAESESVSISDAVTIDFLQLLDASQTS